MSRVAVILLLVVALSVLVTRFEQVHGSRSTPSGPAPGWVRTADGWEPRDAVAITTAPGRPNLHPVVVAAFLGTFSALVLAAFARVPAANDSSRS